MRLENARRSAGVRALIACRRKPDTPALAWCGKVELWPRNFGYSGIFRRVSWSSKETFLSGNEVTATLETGFEVTKP